MKNSLIHKLLLVAAVMTAAPALAARSLAIAPAADSLAVSKAALPQTVATSEAVPLVEAGAIDAECEIPATAPASADTLAAGPDSRRMRLKNRFLPTSRRIDREIRKNKYVYKGEMMLGLTASYGTLSSEDADVFPVFENINLSGAVAAVNPYVAYFYIDNNCVGVRLGYSHIRGTLDTFGVNLGDQNDLDIEIPWIDLSSNRFSVGLFHRSYVALDEKGRFGVFGEFEISYSSGRNRFAYKSGERLKNTLSDNMNVKMLFSPGVAVYAFPNVCATLSFGLGGFKYAAVTQYDEAGEKVGERRSSKLNFRLNLADIRIGVNIHLWNKNKERKVEVK